MNYSTEIAILKARLERVERRNQLIEGAVARLGIDLDEYAIDTSPGVRNGMPSTYAEVVAYQRLNEYAGMYDDCHDTGDPILQLAPPDRGQRRG